MRDLEHTAASGDRRATLEALRDLLAETITAAAPRDRAPLAKQLRDTMVELAGLPDPTTPVNPLQAILADLEAGKGFDVPHPEDS